jgi:protein-tyrosine phosphatase
MIDLHSHILPGIDDGAHSIADSLAMAGALVADGVQIVAATPHIMPGVYANSGPEIRTRVAALQDEIDRRGIPLIVVTGADVHLAPRMVADLASGHLLALADSRYVLIEPPHHVLPPRLEDTFFELLVAGYVPILTHPERLTWIKGHYETIRDLARAGVWMQITSGSLRGAFGSGPKAWAERMLDDGIVHILASDAHDTSRRRPDLSVGYHIACQRVGDEEALHLVLTRPQAILDNRPPSELPAPAGRTPTTVPRQGEAWGASIGDRHEHMGSSGVGSGFGRFSRRLRQLFR